MFLSAGIMSHWLHMRYWVSHSHRHKECAPFLGKHAQQQPSVALLLSRCKFLRLSRNTYKKNIHYISYWKLHWLSQLVRADVGGKSVRVILNFLCFKTIAIKRFRKHCSSNAIHSNTTVVIESNITWRYSLRALALGTIHSQACVSI